MLSRQKILARCAERSLDYITTALRKKDGERKKNSPQHMFYNKKIKEKEKRIMLLIVLENTRYSAKIFKSIPTVDAFTQT